MRTILCTCHSKGAAKARSAFTLDRYLDRIDHETWGGIASNACLDRMTRELRKRATAQTAVTVHTVTARGTTEIPLITIGARNHFLQEEAQRVMPVGIFGSLRAALGIAALFHDMGKASALFQGKLARVLAGSKDGADRIRHELVSALVFDKIAGSAPDGALGALLSRLTPEEIDAAWEECLGRMEDIASGNEVSLRLQFATRPGSLAHLIGMLILTHHRLPETSVDFTSILSEVHVNPEAVFTPADLQIAPGPRYWHEPWFGKALRRDAGRLCPLPEGAELELRDSLMLADHHGSAAARKDGPALWPENTLMANLRGDKLGDTLSEHIRKVWAASRRSAALTFQKRETWPAVDFARLPETLSHPGPREGRFGWQGRAAHAASELGANGGGFFAIIMAGTGSGKTRAAPSIISAAAGRDPDPARRALRVTVGLGLRTLAAQTAREYVEDLHLSPADVSLFIGKTPIEFEEQDLEGEQDGRESLMALPEWLEMEGAVGQLPLAHSPEEPAWLASLSMDSTRGIPPFARAIASESRNQRRFLDLLTAPVAIGTIDHVMAAATPDRSDHLVQALRTGTSDLILDEIDQYDSEDLAAIARLVFRAGAGGRRVAIMSATLPEDVADVLFTAYRNGWRSFSELSGAPRAVDVLACGDAEGALFCEEDSSTATEVVALCRAAQAEEIAGRPPVRNGRIGEEVLSWNDVVTLVDQGVSSLHEENFVQLGGMRVSVGAVRITRIAHGAALASQLPAGLLEEGRMRLKLCLHSNLPRVQREWIESNLARALNRKAHPAENLERFLDRIGVLERARAAGVRDLEIAAICSPVIETGNDIDFDWGILDAISMRSIAQFAGRIRRHRPAAVPGRNILTLPIPLIAMAEGSLSYPGVQTPPHPETGVARRHYDFGADLRACNLAGAAVEGAITAMPFLDQAYETPLLLAEKNLRDDFLQAAVVQGAAGRSIARLSRTTGRMRRFRRSTRGQIALAMLPDVYGQPVWHYDCAPGRRDSLMQPIAGAVTISVSDQSSEDWLVPDILQRAIAEAGGTEVLPLDLLTLVEVDQPNPDLVLPDLHIDTMTGVTRGSFEHLMAAFGRAQGNE